MRFDPNSFLRTANQLLKKGKLTPAKKLVEEVLAIQPSNEGALDLSARILQQQGKFQDSERFLSKLIQLRPNDMLLRLRRGELLLGLGEYDRAETDLVRAEEDGPQKWTAIYLRARVSAARGDLRRATKLLNQCLKLEGIDERPYALLARQYEQTGKTEQAEEVYRRALEHFPESKSLLAPLTNLYYARKDFDAIRNIYENYLRHSPTDPDLLLNMGMLHIHRRDFEAALPWLRRSAELPSLIQPMAIVELAYTQIRICEWEEYDRLVQDLRKAVERYIKDDEIKYEIPVYALMHFRLPRRLIWKTGQKISGLIESNLATQPFQHNVRPNSGRKLRLGYISSQFRKQAVGLLYYDIFRHHDREKFEVYTYSLVHAEDFVSENVATTSDHFYNGHGKPSYEIAQQIAKDQIDILVATAAHYDEFRMDVLAYQPAPIQINAQAYNESTGASFVQYAIVDQDVATPKSSKLYNEALIVLERTAFVNSPLPTTETARRNDYDLPKDAFVYAALHDARKLEPILFDVWAQILKKTKDAILWITDGGRESIRRNLLQQFEKREIPEERLRFTGLLDMKEHWARFPLADLFLDSFVYNAQTTAIESLRNGLPILTLRGQTHNSRYGSSILKAAGLEELICENPEEYIEKAVYHYQNPHVLDELKDRLKGKAHLFDTQAQVRDLEAAFLHVWDRHQMGKEPKSIAVGPSG